LVLKQQGGGEAMTRFVDTHSHGIYAVDDGVQDAEGTLRFLHIANEHGTRLLFLTPHVLNEGKYHPSKTLLKERMDHIRTMVEMHHLPIDVRLGVEVYLDEAGLRLIQAQGHLPYENTRYVLVEFVPPYDPQLIQDALHELSLQNQTMIIAHPERYFSDAQLCVRTARQWVDAGAFLSLNRTSLIGVSKPAVHKNALALLDAGLVHMVASDAHHAPGRREPRLDDVHERLVHWVGQNAADALCSTNPQRLADNQPLLSVHISQRPWDKTVRRLRQHDYRRTLRKV
jgi:protein-tyrosine phosphatase